MDTNNLATIEQIAEIFPHSNADELDLNERNKCNFRYGVTKIWKTNSNKSERKK